MNVLSILKSVRTAAQFEETIPKIDADLRQAEANLTALKGQREGVIFDGGEAALSKLLAEIKDAEMRVETLHIALDGARRRAAEAEANEKNSKLEARHREAQRLPAEERRLLKQWHTAAYKLADLTDQVAAVQKTIAAENSFMASEGRRDLELPTAAAEVSAKRRAMWERHYAGNRHRPVNPPQPIGLNVAHETRITGYYPRPLNDDGVLPAQPLTLLD
ncbi:hypothetical protein DK847_14655 [Aestuariivirga litoralis]|uniref:Uncharacterized protein n=1 Tax=Aestuariivirga litoralis TaxID=2650924 RepID=A0A2W2ARZ9_9HYPH|nr:hypothetical protein [Aestuariivirga litoralis]PZF76412.1 hypothetical protein DK847_14655 [Aestuariivirga litoralis]